MPDDPESLDSPDIEILSSLPLSREGGEPLEGACLLRLLERAPSTNVYQQMLAARLPVEREEDHIALNITITLRWNSKSAQSVTASLDARKRVNGIARLDSPRSLDKSPLMDIAERWKLRTSMRTRSRIDPHTRFALRATVERA